MMSAMAHRGPDGSGMLRGNGIGLGHRRLSIIDIEGGAQPMSSADGSMSVVFNGEIYNYVELRAELAARGCRFTTHSDTEVLLHLYECMGVEMLSRLNGMFAFALWDRARDTVMLARDRVGKKPLYYRVDGGNLLFASELKALLTHSAIARCVAVDALDDYLAYGYVPGASCIISGVSKLPPGEVLVWRRGSWHVHRYWDIRMEHGTATNERQWLDELERRLLDAVRIRLRSDVPLGVFLSGGVDSSAVVALCSEVSSAPLKTFSVGFAERDFDELPDARVVADRFGTDHSELIVEDHDLSILPDIVYHLDEPFADPSALPTYYVCREARRHVTVCLSGDGGDELFAGYARYRQALAYQRWDWMGALGARGMAAAAAGAVPRALPGRGMLERMASRGPARYAGQVGIFSAAERVALIRPDCNVPVRPDGALFESYFAHERRRDLLTTLQHADQKTYLPDDILVKVDRM